MEMATGVTNSLMWSCVISKNKNGLDNKLSSNQWAFSPKDWNTIVNLFLKYIKTYLA